MVNLVSFGCHVTDRAYVRTYASTDCTGGVGVGETIKRLGPSKGNCCRSVIGVRMTYSFNCYVKYYFCRIHMSLQIAYSLC